MPLSLDVPDRGSAGAANAADRPLPKAMPALQELAKGSWNADEGAVLFKGRESWEAGERGVGESVTDVCACEGTVPSWTTTSPHSDASSVNSPRSAMLEPHSEKEIETISWTENDFNSLGS